MGKLKALGTVETFESLVTGEPLEFDLPCGQVGGLGIKL